MKHAHRSSKHARWWNAGGVSMPTDPASMPCDEMLAGVSMSTDPASMPCGGMLAG